MILIRIKIAKLTESMKEDVLQLMKQQKSTLIFQSLELMEQTDKRAAGQTVRESKSKPLCFTATAQKPDGLSNCLASYSSSGRWHSPPVFLLIHQVLFIFRVQSWMKDNENRLHISSCTSQRLWNVHPNCEMWCHTQLPSSKVPASYFKIIQQNQWKAINLKMLSLLEISIISIRQTDQ